MIEPVTLRHQPGLGMLLLGGMAAALVLSGLVLAALHHGFLDFSRLIGGIFTGNPTAAFWPGFWLIFAGGVLGFPPLLSAAWRFLPGPSVGLAGAAVKGLVWGLALWAVTGLLLPLFGVLNQLEGPWLADPGFFALSHGLSGPAWLALGTVSYGICVALIAAMPQGITPLDIIGWEGYRPGENQKEGIF